MIWFWAFFFVCDFGGWRLRVEVMGGDGDGCGSGCGLGGGG